MKQVNRTFQIQSPFLPALSMALTLWLTTGCGQGFESSMGSQNQQNFHSQSVELKNYLNDINAFSYDETTGGPRTDSSAGAPGLVRFYRDLDVKFDPIANGLGNAHKSLKESLWKDCREGSNIDPTREYQCGEVPVGKIVDLQNKLIINIPFEGLKGKTNGVKYKVSAENIPIFLSRHQTASNDSINTLDEKVETAFEIGTGIIDSVFFRIKPNAGTLETEICIFAPGMRITSQKAKVKVKLEKEILWGMSHLRAEADVKIEPGDMTFDSADFCALFYAKTDENWQTKLDFQRLKAPTFKNLVHNGLKVDVDVEPKGILKVINGVLKIVGVNLAKKAEKMAKEQLQDTIEGTSKDILASEIHSGKWFHEYVKANAILKEVLPKIEAQINRTFKYLGPSSENLLQSRFRRACDSITKDWELGSINFDKICKASIRVKSHLFLKDAESEQAGCYSNFFRPGIRNEVKNKWWSKNCKIKNKIEIVAAEELAPLYHCIANVINDSESDSFDIGTCEHELALLVEATKDFKIPTTELLESFEDRIKKDPDYEKWEELITSLDL